MPDSKKSDSIHQLLTKVVNNGEAPGMIAAIISNEGVVAIASVGERKAGSGIAFTINDVVQFRIVYQINDSYYDSHLGCRRKASLEYKTD